MDRFATFPPETLIYFGHEYTISNLRFALTVEPDNQDIHEYMSHCQEQRKAGSYTTPTTVAQELKVNPFLRIDQEDVIRFVDPGGAITGGKGLDYSERQRTIFEVKPYLAVRQTREVAFFFLEH